MQTSSFIAWALVGLLEFRVLALALTAINPLSLVTTCAATVTAVPATATIVVVIVTTTVSFVLGISTFARAIALLERGVYAFTFAAVQELSLVATASTAVSFVPTTAAVVVVIVATTIAHISGHPALFFTWAAAFLFNFGVLALTLFTVRKLILVARASAAVTLIPSTCAVVVFVIASTVASVIRYTTFASAISFGLVRFVFALALRTVGVLVLGTTDTTAIAPIVFASAVVIVVIAVSIADPCGRTTCAGAATVIILWIKTLAFRAVNKLVFVARCTTAISAVPTAATVVVIVVTTTIFFVFGLCTLATTLAFRRFWWRFCRWGLWILTFTFLAV